MAADPLTGGAGEVRRSVVVRHAEGFHARPCALLAALANRYRSSIQVRRGDQAADGKSVLELMMLTVAPGDAVDLVAEGPDARDLVEAVAALIERDFEA